MNLMVVVVFHVTTLAGLSKQAEETEAAFLVVCCFNNHHQRTKTDPSVAQGALSRWQEESRSAYRQLLFFR